MMIARLSGRSMLSLIIVFLVGGVAMLSLVNIDTSYLYLSISMALIGIGIGLADPTKKAIVLSKANQSRIGVITFTFNTIENVVQRVGASFAIIMFALFAAGGNAVNALSSTALFLPIY